MDLMTECSGRGVVLCNLCATESSSRTRGVRTRIIRRSSKPWRSIVEDEEKNIDNGQGKEWTSIQGSIPGNLGKE